MGYSICVQAPSKELQDQMYVFLCANWDYIVDHKPFKFDSGTALSMRRGRKGMEGISYGPDDVPHLVGFDYSSWISDEETIHVRRVVDWMREALQASGYYYDGELVEEAPKTREDMEKRSNYYLINIFHTKKYIKRALDFVFDDVERLKKLWGNNAKKV